MHVICIYSSNPLTGQTIPAYVRIGMFAKWPHIVFLLSVALVLAGYPGPVSAQFDDEFGEDDFFGGDDDGFGSGDDFFGTPEEDFTDGGEFVDESQLPPAQVITEGGRQFQLRALGERERLPMNAAWGAGTGLMIGGWFALINNGTNRETQRSLGLGIVVGTIIGITVGIRSLIAPNAPIPISQSAPSLWGEPSSALAVAGASPFRFNYTLKF